MTHRRVVGLLASVGKRIRQIQLELCALSDELSLLFHVGQKGALCHRDIPGTGTLHTKGRQSVEVRIKIIIKTLLCYE